MHQRPEGVEEHERQRPLAPLHRSLHLPAPGSVSSPPPPSLPLYPCSGLPHPAPASLLLPLQRPPMAAVPPPLPLRPPAPLAALLGGAPSWPLAVPPPPRLAAGPSLPVSLTFQRLDDLELVGQVGPPGRPHVQVAQGHDALGGRHDAVLAQGVVQAAVASSPAVPLLLEEAPLAQVVLPAQRQAAQGEPQVLRPARLLLSGLGAAGGSSELPLKWKKSYKT